MNMLNHSLAGVIALCGSLVSAPSLAQSIDDEPSQVIGLSATVYSGTAAGLKWQGASGDRRVRGYLVLRDDEVLEEVDARSFIITDLEPGQTYNYAVMPVYASGEPSGGTIAIQFTTPGGGNVVDAPDTPSLRAAVYSRTAAGLAWTRPADPGNVSKRVAQYEVRRDGVLVATTRAVSYIDLSLAAGTTYEFQVVAINAQGGRAAPARLSVSTPGTRVGGNDSPDPAVAAPTGLRSTAYSSTAAGIAWARPTTPGFRYAVSRDGTSLGTTDGTSYVDQTLAGDRTYRYEVVAIDRQGRRSAASSVTVNTPAAGARPTAPATQPVATVPTLDQGAEDILAALAGYQAESKVADIRAFAAQVIDTASAMRELPAPDVDVVESSPSEQVSVSSTETEYDCALGGQMAVKTIDITVFESDGDRVNDEDTYRFDQCRFGRDDSPVTVYYGDLMISDLSKLVGDNRHRTVTYVWDEFESVENESEALAITGTLAVETNDYDPVESTRRVAIDSYERSIRGGFTNRLEQAALTLRTLIDGPYRVYELSASGTVVHPSATDGAAVTVSTDEPLFSRYTSLYESNNTGQPFAGSLSYRSDDGRSLDVEVLDTWTPGFRVDRRYTGADGESSERTDVPFADLTVELAED